MNFASDNGPNDQLVMATLNRVDYALELRSRGFICLPLSKGGRHLTFPAMDLEPLHLHTMRKNLKELAFSGVTYGLSQRPPEPETIRRWFDGHDGNIGILGGFADLIVLDFDKSVLFYQMREMNEQLFNSTPIERTPNGYHVYLKCSTPRVSSSLHFGMRRAGHIKALGGYVVSSPSTLKDGSTYNWLQNQSPFDVEPQYIESVEDLSVHPNSPLKRWYDRVWRRGSFNPD